MEETNEYCETHYYMKNFKKAMIPLTSFWADYAEYLLSAEEGKSFLSSNFYLNGASFSSQFFTLAVLDLPFDSETHGFKTNEGRGVEIKAVHNLVLFKKEVKETPKDLKTDLIITHRYLSINEGNISV